MDRTYVITRDVSAESTVIEFDHDPPYLSLIGIDPHTPPGMFGTVYREVVWNNNGSFVRGVDPSNSWSHKAGTPARVIGIAKPDFES